MGEKMVALKVDVDTFAGTRDGVPALLAEMERFAVKATFYFSMGPDNSGKAIRRIFTRKGFLKKQLRSGASSTYGVKTMLYGTLLPAPMIAASLPDMLRAVEQQGHQAGVHCWDHVKWHDYLNRFRCAQASNREVLLRPQFRLRDAALAIDRLGAALSGASGLLRERVSRKRILDGHGDLRPEHVCLLQPPVVFDCLEFNPLLRQVDPFDEMAYLSMECDMAGAPWIGPQLVSGVSDALHDHPHAALPHFYTAHCALLRARLAMAHLLDPKPRLPEKWQPLAERYLTRALSATADFICAMQRGKPG